MILDGLFRNDASQVDHYHRLLKPVLVGAPNSSTLHNNDDHKSSENPPPQYLQSTNSEKNLVPEVYIVPKDKVQQEKTNRGSTSRIPNENIPLVWAQSLYILSTLIMEDLLSPGELDPLGRRLALFKPMVCSELIVQVVLLAENAELQATLASYGLKTQTLDECAPMIISPPSALRDAYCALGENKKLVCNHVLIACCFTLTILIFFRD